MFAYKAKLEAMESDEFAKLKSSLCSKLTERLFSEKKLWRCYWGEITDGTFCFDWKKETAQKVEALTKEDVLALYPEFLEPSQQHCLILEYGKSKGNEFSPASDNARVYSTEEFRSIQEFLPKQWVAMRTCPSPIVFLQTMRFPPATNTSGTGNGNRSVFVQFSFKRKSQRKENYEY